MRKMLLLILTTVLLCGLTNAQQIIAYQDQKIGIGLNGDKFFSPEIQLKVNRHSLLTDYYIFEPSLGCKIRYYRSERGYIYTGAFASAVYAYNFNSEELLRIIIPDIHLVGFEVYPFEKYFAGFSIFARVENFERLNAEWAFLIRF